MTRRTLLAVAVLALGGCAPTLRYNQTFLVSEDLKVTSTGYVSLKSTGETFDLSPIRAQEQGGERIVIAKINGTFVMTGEGFERLWRLVPSGGNEATYEPIEYDPGPGGFASPTLEIVGACAVVHWDRGGNAAVAYVNADGDVDETKCKDP